MHSTGYQDSVVGGEKLFIGNLPYNAMEAEIYNYFAPFGRILEVYCLGPNKSRSGQACAFVRFADASAAMAAVEQLDGRVSLRPHEAPELFMQVRPARSQPLGADSTPSKRVRDVYQFCSDGGAVKLFVGNLPLDATAEELNTLFKTMGVSIRERETFIMSRRGHQNNAVCAFVVVSSVDEANQAIQLMDGKSSLRSEFGPVQVRIAKDSQPSPARNRPRAHSDPVLTDPSAYGSGHYLLPAPTQVNWKDPSIKTYHHYMFMPQSINYGPMNVVPGSEPWRNNGIYSLPPATFSQPSMGL